MNMRLYEKVVEWARAGKRVAVVSIVQTVGSTPRKAGAKMIVTDKLEIFGTIGGGCVEADVILAARDVLRTMKPQVVRVDIKAKNADEIDMLCGGEVTLYVEPVMPDYKLLICGGGHISKALARVCEGLEFRITIVDDREQFANNDRFPGVDTIMCDYGDLTRHFIVTPFTFCVVVTRGHSGDEVCLRQLLATDVPYIAMVGSRGKWAILKKNLKDAGATDAQIGRVICPAGIDIQSITPEEIAVSIAAQLIQARAKIMSGATP
ncbi:XdhC family protein [Candidatus Sumerlaeota bacterium]|nr:XdhC family protein [Candidatus Sumerlaeota bacterium]